MRNTTDSGALTAIDMRIALSEIYPESTYGAVPQALAAYVAFHQHQWM